MPVTMRMNLENMLSEISQAQKDYISYDHTYTTHLEIVKFTATEDRMVVTRDWRWARKWRIIAYWIQSLCMEW